MGSLGGKKQGHAVCVPFPAQGHITPMLKLAKLLHSKGGLHVTFVNTEFNHNRLLRARGSSALRGLDDFRFETIPDGLQPSDEDATQHIPSLCDSITTNCLASFRDLVAKLPGPPVTCVITDVFMTFAIDAAAELGVPAALFWAASTCGLMAYFHYSQLISRGLIPLRDEGDLTNGYLDTPVDWIPGMTGMRLRDFPSFIRTTDANEVVLNYIIKEMERISMATCIVMNTFDDFERPVLNAMSSVLPPVYTVGPLLLLSGATPPESPLASIRSNLWKEDDSCLAWLDGRAPRSVVYVNFGSTTVMTKEQMVEFAWGLADSGRDFLWVIRPDLVRGDTAALPAEFVAAVEGRSLLSSWCPQEEVLQHAAVGGFLTHGGWNSMLESLCGGVPVVCWPFFAEQQTNCRYACTEWGIGMEIGGDVRRGEVEALVRELMDGEKGREMRKRALELKESAIRATRTGGSSNLNLERLVEDGLLPKK